MTNFSVSLALIIFNFREWSHKAKENFSSHSNLEIQVFEAAIPIKGFLNLCNSKRSFQNYTLFKNEILKIIKFHNFKTVNLKKKIDFEASEIRQTNLGIKISFLSK